MYKPKEIIVLEEELGITLERLKYKEVFNIASRNYYQCDSDDRITRLNLSNNGFEDLSILSNFPYLTHLYLGDNQISDLSFLGNLPNLTNLFLENNQITDLSALEQVSNLTQLSLSNNQINDLSALRSVPLLTQLDLINNSISDFSALKYLSHLTHLYLNSNRISNLSVLEYLADLTQLYLSNNQIVDLSVLKSLSNLTHLDLSNNQIVDLSVLEYLPNLTYLNLNDNFVSNVLVLEYLPCLTSLFLGGNQIDDLSIFRHLSRLTYLYLNNNLIIDLSVLEYLPNLTQLYLSNNRIIDLSALEYLTNLTQLDLSGNQIDDLSVLESLPHLTQLYLSSNKISDLSVLEYLSNLSILVLGNNLISDLSALSFTPNLSILKLSTNRISDLSVLSSLSNLTQLELNYNPISDLSILEFLPHLTHLCVSSSGVNDFLVLKFLPLLTHLDLSNNQISDLSVLSSLSHLTHLELRGNHISYLSVLSSFPHLTHLDLSNNQISDLSALSSLSNLIQLHLKNNRISDLFVLSSLYKLTQLELSGNQISDISVLRHLPNLTILALGNNQISDISVLKNLPNLSILVLGNNQVSDLFILRYLPHLIQLDLSDNPIGDLSVLSSLSHLTQLELSGNQISDISMFSSLSSLTQLDLRNNQVSDLSVLSSLSHLTQLELSGNQINDISMFSSLSNLTQLDLSNNQISDLSVLKYLPNLLFLFLRNNLINDINEFDYILSTKKLLYLSVNNNPFVSELGLVLNEYENHLNIIKNELEKSRNEFFSVKLPQKIMLLGNHASGKSSFLHYFFYNEWNEEDILSTDILNIQPYFNKKKKETKMPDAIFYDFGGQDYYHGVYQAFFTLHAINILFWHENSDINDERQDVNNYITHHFDRGYWLGQIAYALNKQRSPEEKIEIEDVIWLVQTFADIDRRNNWKKEGIIANEFFISLSKNFKNRKNKLALQYLLLSLKEEIGKNRKVKKTRNEINLYEYIINQKGHKPIDISVLEEIYKQGKDALKGELTQLARRGVVLYYDNEIIGDKVWLNPADTVQHIHRDIINKIRIESDGRIPFDKFQSGDDLSLIELLKNEKVIFEDRGAKEYIVPGYLPLADENTEEVYWIKLNFSRPSFILKFESFIPFGLINQLICYYGQNPDKKKYYRNLLLFTYKAFNAKVMIRLDFKNLEILVCIHPLDVGKQCDKEVPREILDDILDMYWGRNLPPLTLHDEKDDEKDIEMKRDRRREKIPHDLYLSIDGEYFVPFAQLEQEHDFSQPFISYPITKDKVRKIDKTKGKGCNNVYQYRHLSLNPKIKNMKKIFISYSKYDKQYLHEFDKHLVNMKDQGLISVYYDELTGLGEDIHKTINDRMEECDFMISLVSVDYMATPYIRDVELDYIKRNAKKLIPIIVRPCDWEHHRVIGPVYAPQKGDCITVLTDGIGNDTETSQAERDAKWTKVVKELRLKLGV